MKYKLLLTLSVLLIFGTFDSNACSFNSDFGTDSLILKLADMKTNSLDCSADTYWEIVSKGKEYIPKLIAALTDTTSTSIYDDCKGGNLNIGEVCYFALNEIADFPAFLVTHIQFDTAELKKNKFCWSFYDYFFDNRNKSEYQEKVKAFYEKTSFKFAKFNNSKITDCMKKYQITGKYELINK